MKKLIVLLIVLSFSCKKKETKVEEPVNPPVVVVPAGVVTVKVKSLCGPNAGFIKISWEYPQQQQDSVYSYPNNSEKSYSKKTVSDSIKITPSYLCTSDYTVYVDGIAVATKLGDKGNLTVYKIK